MAVKKRKLLNPEDKLRLRAQIEKDKRARIEKRFEAEEKKRGRRPFAVDDWHRLWVCRYKGMKYSNHTIACAFGIDQKTLEKYFPEEIKNGAERAKCEVTAMIFNSAEEGNIGAQRKLYSIMHDEVEVIADASDDAGKGKKLGKKEQQLIDASKVESKYEAPEPPKPKMMVVN